MCRMSCGLVGSTAVVPKEVREGYWIPWNWSYSLLWATIWMLGIKPKSLQEQSVLLLLNHLSWFYFILFFEIGSQYVSMTGLEFTMHLPWASRVFECGTTYAQLNHLQVAKENKELAITAHACHCSTLEALAGGWGVQGHSCGSGWLYINLTQALVIWDNGSTIEKMAQ